LIPTDYNNNTKNFMEWLGVTEFKNILTLDVSGASGNNNRTAVLDSINAKLANISNRIRSTADDEKIVTSADFTARGQELYSKVLKSHSATRGPQYTNSGRIAENKLTYYMADNKSIHGVNQVGITTENMDKLDIIGKIRFDTVLVRNLLFVTILQAVGSSIMREAVFSQTSTIERGIPSISSANYKLTGTDNGDDAHKNRLSSIKAYDQYNVWS
jgi:hypothetical protein